MSILGPFISFGQYYSYLSVSSHYLLYLLISTRFFMLPGPHWWVSGVLGAACLSLLSCSLTEPLEFWEHGTFLDFGTPAAFLCLGTPFSSVYTHSLFFQLHHRVLSLYHTICFRSSFTTSFTSFTVSFCSFVSTHCLILGLRHFLDRFRHQHRFWILISSAAAYITI